MSTNQNPHEAVIRLILGEPANAASYLRSVLPAALAERLDLDRLKRVPGSFVDDDLKSCHTGLLFSVPVVGRESHPGSGSTSTT
jgi:predicted transposase YdaD